MIRIHVLGPLQVTVPGTDQRTLPRAARRLIALIAAAGPDGITRDNLATELWGEPLPESWKSALRNRVATARKVLGADAISNDGGRYQFGDKVSVDSWDVIKHSLGHFDLTKNEMAFLDGETLVDIKPCPLSVAHAQNVVDARAAIMQEVTSDGNVLSPLALQSMRTYRRRHPSAAIVAIATIKAHVHAGEGGQAAMLVEEIKADAAEAAGRPMAWALQLEQLLDTATPRRRHDDNSTAAERKAEDQARAEMFAAAAFDENWSLALEVALAGLPAAARSSGDPERLTLLRQIPLPKLDPMRKFNYCLAMTRQLVYAGFEDEAREWSHTAARSAKSPDQQLLAYIMAAMVGESIDERAPIPLPTTFEEAPDESVNMQSLQVAVMNHLERATYEDVAPLQRRFTTLVEASADPYRRWHLLLLDSMTLFVAGEIEAATAAAWQAYNYAKVFNIAEAQGALIGQLSNAHWVHSGFVGIDDYFTAFPGTSDMQIGQALQAVSTAPVDAGAAVHEFLRNYNYNSRSFFAFSMVTLLAPHIIDAQLRTAVANRLKARTGTSVIRGTGELHLGPVDRTVALLTADQVDRDIHLSAAVHVADRQHLRIWQVVCRLDLASATGNQELRHQADELATTPALQELVMNYTPRF